ncbi:hypothetical protein LUZ60_002415 [Juncus effusus]|nr:hypothetical protein LUZ60_002415 [Juncus effusus]
MASSSSSPSLRIIETSSIGLPASTPIITSIPLTHYDIPWSVTCPVERLFFYNFPHPTSYFLSSVLSSLKSSLSLTLAKFYPLAGVIRPTSDIKYEIYCTENDSVDLTVAESSDDFQHLSSQNARLVSRLEPVVPCLKGSNKSKKLFAVQVTIFPDRGLVIGIAVRHDACDGTSSMQFVQSWAAMCRSGVFDSSLNPVIDRALASDPTDLYSLLYNLASKMINSSKENQAPMDPNMVQASFTLTRDHIGRLKNVILCKAEEKNTSFHCSTLVIAFAYAWISHVKARGVSTNNKHNLLFPADFRVRLQPPLPPTYFGNCVKPCIVEMDSDDLISQNRLFMAAEALGKCIEGLSSGEKFREDWIRVFELLANPCSLTVAGSPKFRVYEVDFGWGRPARVDILSVSKTGALAMAESREERGGVEIGLALPQRVMDCFEKHFVGALEI